MICDVAFVVRNALPIKDWFAFEAVLIEYAPRYPQFLMCLHNLDRFSGEMVMNVLQTHPGSSSTDNYPESALRATAPVPRDPLRMT